MKKSFSQFSPVWSLTSTLITSDATLFYCHFFLASLNLAFTKQQSTLLPSIYGLVASFSISEIVDRLHLCMGNCYSLLMIIMLRSWNFIRTVGYCVFFGWCDCYSCLSFVLLESTYSWLVCVRKVLRESNFVHIRCRCSRTTFSCSLVDSLQCYFDLGCVYACACMQSIDSCLWGSCLCLQPAITMLATSPFQDNTCVSTTQYWPYPTDCLSTTMVPFAASFIRIWVLNYFFGYWFVILKHLRICALWCSIPPDPYM